MIRLLQIPAGVLGTIIVLVVVSLFVSGLLVARRRLNQEKLRNSNDVADSVYSMVGVLYAVLLAFMVVVVWEQYTTAEDHAQLEGSAVGDLLRETQAFSPEVRGVLRAHLINYAKDVVDHEWPAMAAGENVSIESPAFRTLWGGYLAFQPAGNEQMAFYSDSISRLNELGNHRKIRILSSHAELPGMLWILLIGGSVISIFFTYVFGTENGGVHVLVVVLLSSLLSFVLFLVFSLEHPYSGSLSVKPVAFQAVIEAFAKAGG